MDVVEKGPHTYEWTRSRISCAQMYLSWKEALMYFPNVHPLNVSLWSSVPMGSTVEIFCMIFKALMGLAAHWRFKLRTNKGLFGPTRPFRPFHYSISRTNSEQNDFNVIKQFVPIPYPLKSIQVSAQVSKFLWQTWCKDHKKVWLQYEAYWMTRA